MRHCGDSESRLPPSPPEHRPKGLPQLKYARAEKLANGALGISKLLEMSYSPPPLNSQREGRRYLVSPLFVESGCLEPVERAVHLNRGQMLRGVGKLIDLA